MGAHAPFSPSSSSRWLNCTASHQLEKGYPDTDSVYSREGTFAHAIGERALLQRRDPEHYIGTKSDDGEFTWSAEDAAQLRHYTDHIHALALIEGGWPVIEQRVKFSRDCWGTADAMFLSQDGRRLYIIDLKWGSGVVVNPAKNDQCLTYAACAFAEAKAAGKPMDHVEEVHLQIVQPRAGVEPVRSSIVSPEDVAKHAERMVFAFADAAQGGTLVPGKWCRWCKHHGACEAVREQALELAQTVFDPPAMAPSEIATLLDTLPQIEAWVRAVKENAKSLALEGLEIPGYKLVETYGNRKWLDEVETMRALTDAGMDPWAPQVLKSPAAVESDMKKQGLKPKQRAAIVNPLTHRPQNGPALVPESDKRPAVPPKLSAGEVFNKIEDSTSNER